MAIVSLDAQEAVNGDEPFNLAEQSLALRVEELEDRVIPTVYTHQPLAGSMQ